MHGGGQETLRTTRNPSFSTDGRVKTGERDDARRRGPTTRPEDERPNQNSLNGRGTPRGFACMLSGRVTDRSLREDISSLCRWTTSPPHSRAIRHPALRHSQSLLQVQWKVCSHCRYRVSRSLPRTADVCTRCSPCRLSPRPEPKVPEVARPEPSPLGRPQARRPVLVVGAEVVAVPNPPRKIPRLLRSLPRQPGPGRARSRQRACVLLHGVCGELIHLVALVFAVLAWPSRRSGPIYTFLFMYRSSVGYPYACASSHLLDGIRSY